jgi:hypothetical protein
MAELIWDGKYDEHGKKRAPVRIELPFQTVETVNESVGGWPTLPSLPLPVAAPPLRSWQGWEFNSAQSHHATGTPRHFNRTGCYSLTSTGPRSS